MGVEETPLEELVRVKDSQVKEEVLPEEMVIREGGGGGGDDIPKIRKQKGPKYVYVLQGPPG